MKKQLLQGMLALLAICLCACGGAGPQSGSERPQSLRQPETNDTHTELKLVTSTEGMFGLVGSVSPNGYYDIRFNEDGSSNIVYTDFDTAQTVYLSSDVVASHTSEEDPSWFQYGISYLFVINDKLYAVYPGALFAPPDSADAKKACVYEMRLDGSERRVLTEFEASKRMMHSVATDGDSFYTVIEAVTPLGQNVNELTKVDLETGEQEVLCAMPIGEFVVGAFKDQLVLENVIDSETNPMNLSVFSLAALEQKQLVSVSNETTSGVAYRDSFYYIDHTDQSFVRADLNTGESAVVQESIPVGSKQTTFVSGIWENYFVYRVTTMEGETEKQQLYGIDLNSGSIYKNSLTYSYQGSIDHSVNIVAAAKNQYLFVRDRTDETKTFYAADGTAYQALDTRFIYGLENVQTFWSDVDQKKIVADLT